VTGRANDLLLLVVGDVDDVELIKKLTDKVGAAEIVELRTLQAGDAFLDMDVVVTQSPYHQWRHHSTPGRSVPGGGRIECPFSAAARQQADYHYPRTSSPLQLQYHHPSPVAGQAVYAGSRYNTLTVARSHPANYSPMIARHDYRAVARTRGPDHDGGGPSCCTIL
jgi:hypothetical protein